MRYARNTFLCGAEELGVLDHIGPLADVWVRQREEVGGARSETAFHVDKAPVTTAPTC